MTTKDYKKIAKAIKSTKEDMTERLIFRYAGLNSDYALLSQEVLGEVIHKIGIVFANENPRFDYAKFFKACTEDVEEN